MQVIVLENLPTLTWEEFRSLEWPHEWVGGVAYAMGATSPRHARMCARLAGQLPDRGGCSAYAAGLVVYVPELDRGFLPDLVVICGEPAEAEGKPGAITNPTIVFEVLSKSTQTYDRTTKLEAYRRVESLEAYVILHQLDARAEVFRREADGWTASEQTGGSIELPRGLTVDLAAL
jgi:Uma2 family endonuclease